ncbi:hypothetical protein B0A48_14167 [Cryoendolithus antarcticus]|uniref:G domain-containing protein n=1 Tax=Cryoendolithus antarcticus TaxID=1507870 RepID=A0A1V8SLE6_9PEZI|nr:hypothetical protein B0A48_14167 [Cryoendolithus antarcticus]
MQPASILKRKRVEETDGDDQDISSPLRRASCASGHVQFVDGSDSDVEGSDPDEPTYNETMEDLPKHPAFDPELCKVNECDVASAQALLDVMRIYEHDSEGLASGLKWATKNLSVSDIKKPTIGIVGGMGAGKSSVVNALLDAKDIATVVSAGEACTSVMTIYTHKVTGQRSPYGAEVSYPSDAECEKIISDRLDNYNLWYLQRDTHWSEADKEDDRKDANTAFESFRSLFNDKAEFTSDAAAKKTLKANYETPTQPLMRKLVDWTKQKLQLMGLRDDVRTLTLLADTESVLAAQLKPLTISGQPLRSPSLWSLVRKVVVGNTTSRVLEYVNIVDIPGFDDTNMARVNMTREALRDCQYAWVVAPIGRIVSDPNLERFLVRFGEFFAGKLTIIATYKEDRLNKALVEYVEEHGQDMDEYRQLQGAIRDRQHELTTRERDMRRKSANKSELALKVHELKMAIYEFGQEQDEILMEARAVIVTENLHITVDKLIPEGRNVPVFCVSNTMYEELKEGDYSCEGSAHLAEVSGIPALRAHALLAAAPGRWRSMSDLLCNRVAVFFHNVSVWVRNDPTEANAGLHGSLNALRNFCEEGNEQAIKQTSALFDAHLIHTIRSALPSALADAQHFRAVNIDPMHWATMHANIRKNGHHRGRNAGACRDSWTERLMRFCREHHIVPAWDRMPKPLDQPYLDVLSSAIDMMMALPTQLASDGKAVSLAPGVLQRIIEGKVQGIRTRYNNKLDNLSHALGNIKLDATLDHDTAYFAKAMSSCYEDGAKDNGTGLKAGLKARLLRRLIDHLNDEQPHSQAVDRLQKTLENTLVLFDAEVQATYRDAISDITQAVKDLTTQNIEHPNEAIARYAVGTVLARERLNVADAALRLANIRAKYPVVEVEDFTVQPSQTWTGLGN